MFDMTPFLICQAIALLRRVKLLSMTWKSPSRASSPQLRFSEGYHHDSLLIIIIRTIIMIIILSLKWSEGLRNSLMTIFLNTGGSSQTRLAMNSSALRFQWRLKHESCSWQNWHKSHFYLLPQINFVPIFTLPLAWKINLDINRKNKKDAWRKQGYFQ